MTLPPPSVCERASSTVVIQIIECCLLQFLFPYGIKNGAVVIMQVMSPGSQPCGFITFGLRTFFVSLTVLSLGFITCEFGEQPSSDPASAVAIEEEFIRVSAEIQTLKGKLSEV